MSTPSTPNKIAIVGFASSSRGQAPLDDPSFEIWSMNHAPLSWLPKWDVLFELHTMDHLRRVAAHQTTPNQYLDWLAKQPGPKDKGHKPIYMQDVTPDVPASVKLPREELNHWFTKRDGLSLDGQLKAATDQWLKTKIGTRPPRELMGWTAWDYWTSTVSYMLAVAIMRAPKEIHLYGIDLLQDDEYCIGPDTKVLTADLRWVRAGDLRVGDELVGFDEDPKPGLPYRRWRKSTVEAVQVLKRPGRKLLTSDGKSIMCSAEHRWLTRCGGYHRWRTTDELVYPGHPQYRPGRPSRLYKICDTWEEDRSWDAGYLAAAFDGEGWVCQTPHRECRAYNAALGFSQRDNAMMREVLAAAERCGFSLGAGSTSNGSNGDCTQYRVLGGRTEILRFLGSIRPRRLLDLFSIDSLGSVKLAGEADVVSVTDIGEQEVIGLRTSTKTFVAEGFATHNSYQRPGSEYLIGYARGMGIPVFVPEQSALCKANYVYGWTEPPLGTEKVKPLLDYVEDKTGLSQKAVDKANNDAHVFNGALQMADLALTWLDKLPEEDKTLKECLTMKRDEMRNKLQAAQHSSLVMQGQTEAFRTCGVWAKHYARGGELKP